jgi:hypothetical protein
MAAHRRLRYRAYAPWHVEAWPAVAGDEGIGEAFAMVDPERSDAERFLSPLLHVDSSAAVPGMRALLGGPLDRRARAWLEARV